LFVGDGQSQWSKKIETHGKTFKRQIRGEHIRGRDTLLPAMVKLGLEGHSSRPKWTQESPKGAVIEIGYLSEL